MKLRQALPSLITCTLLAACGESPLKPATSALSAVVLNATSIVGGASTKAVISLDAAAPAAGAVVSLSSGSSLAAVPQSVTVAAGATSATVDVTTTPVTAALSVTISASYQGTTRTTTLTLTPLSIGIATIVLAPTPVTGGSSAQATITIAPAAPAGGAIVALSSSVAAVVPTPQSLTISGGATSAVMTLTTLPVSASTDVVITALYGTNSKSATLTVTPPIAVLAALTAAVSSLKGGLSTQGTVVLNGPAPSGGATVVLSSSDGAASVPATVTVPAGATSATFSIATGPVGNSTPVTITAAYAGATKTVSLSVVP